jgi:hypothetical protein
MRMSELSMSPHRLSTMLQLTKRLRFVFFYIIKLMTIFVVQDTELSPLLVAAH